MCSSDLVDELKIVRRLAVVPDTEKGGYGAMTRDKMRRTVDFINANIEVTGQRLKTVPRGYDKEHPRIELLKMKTVLGMRSYGFEPFVHTAELLDRVREDWRRLRPLVTWVADAIAE